MITPLAINSIGWQYYIVFATIAACVPVSVYFLFPETMGRSLEEIDLMFKESPSAWGTVQFEKQSRKLEERNRGSVPSGFEKSAAKHAEMKDIED